MTAIDYEQVALDEFVTLEHIYYAWVYIDDDPHFYSYIAACERTVRAFMHHFVENLPLFEDTECENIKQYAKRYCHYQPYPGMRYEELKLYHRYRLNRNAKHAR